MTDDKPMPEITAPYETVLVDRTDAVATITMNRPERRNALNRPLERDRGVVAGLRQRLLSGGCGGDPEGGDAVIGSTSVGVGLGSGLPRHRDIVPERIDRFLGNVGLNRMGTDGRGRVLEPCLVASRDRDLGTGFDERFGNRSADARTSASDERYLLGEHHGVCSLTQRWAF